MYFDEIMKLIALKTEKRRTNRKKFQKQEKYQER